MDEANSFEALRNSIQNDIIARFLKNPENRHHIEEAFKDDPEALYRAKKCHALMDLNDQVVQTLSIIKALLKDWAPDNNPLKINDNMNFFKRFMVCAGFPLLSVFETMEAYSKEYHHAEDSTGQSSDQSNQGDA